MNVMDPLQALRQREQELLTTLEATGGGRWAWDLRSHQLSFYGDFYRPYGLLDLPYEERTAYWHGLQHPDDVALITAQLQPILSGNTTHYEVEFRVKNSAGSWRWVLVRGRTTEHEGDGLPLRIVGVITDITERRATEGALQASEAQYNTIFHTLPDPAGVVRVADGVFLKVNPAFCALFGLAREAVVGHTAQELSIWASADEFARLMRIYHRNGAVNKLTMLAQSCDGRQVHGLMSAHPIPMTDEACFVFVFHDVTRQRRLYDELQASNSLLQQAGRLARLGVWEDQPGQGPVYWSDVCYEIHGLAHGSPLPRDYVQKHVAPAWHETFRNALRQCIRQRMEWNIEIEIVRADGRLVWMRALGEPVVENGRVVRIRGVMQDIDASKRAEAQVREREALLSLTLAAASLGRWDWNLQTGLIQGDTCWLAMRGFHPDDEGANEPVPWQACTVMEDAPLITRELERHTRYSQTHFDVTWRMPQRGGGVRWIRNLGKTVAHDAAGIPLRMLGVSIDVTHQHEHQEQLHRLAHHDSLTGLPNRVLLARYLAQAMEQAQTLGSLLGVAYLDLDGFKPINDQHGHETGDHLLVMAANRLTCALRTTDCVARLGGDEFVILLPGLRNHTDCEKILSHVMKGLAEPYTLGNEAVTITASIGYTLYPQDDSDADTLLRHADQAMYHAKRAGRNRFSQFDTASEREAQQVQAHTALLHLALTQNQFELYLQPKVDMRLGTVVGAEALIRWNHPEKGILAPGSFLPQMQGTALEIIFGAWVVDTALDMAMLLHNRGLVVPISINIAAPHLQQANFADWLAQRIACYPQLPRDRLRIEITETAAIYNLESVAQTLLRLRDMGVSTALDDFGTGYSSLTYLRRLPLETIKIDQSFVRGMEEDPGDLAIVQGVIGLARSFDYRVIAEGVETVAQGSMLLDMGCDLAQGYCIARPMPLKEFVDWVGRWEAPLPWQHTTVATDH